VFNQSSWEIFSKSEDLKFTSLLHGTESVFRKWNSFSWAKNLLSFMEHEGPSPCSQQSATGPYPEPDESIPYPHALFHWHLFQYFLTTKTNISSLQVYCNLYGVLFGNCGFAQTLNIEKIREYIIYSSPHPECLCFTCQAARAWSKLLSLSPCSVVLELRITSTLPVYGAVLCHMDSPPLLCLALFLREGKILEAKSWENEKPA
jgi:hypothetical protein